MARFDEIGGTLVGPPPAKMQGDITQKQERLFPKPPYTREQYLADFKRVVMEMVELTARKNHDYGGPTDPWKNFQDFGELGILVRMSDKFARIKTALVEKRGLQVSDETVEDTIKDLAVYAVILLLWRQTHRG